MTSGTVIRDRRAVLGALVMGAALLLLPACQALYSNHGYIPDDEELAMITVGRDTRATVSATLGPPSVEGLLNDVGWFYVQSRWKAQGITAPKEIDRQVVAITFTEQGVVSNVEKFGLERGEIVPISRRVTSEPVKGQGFLRQLFGNIGGIAAGDFLKP
jgi:outer membrane protein assembly factor BamE (lipoprotein component of BamABCDE complex)